MNEVYIFLNTNPVTKALQLLVYCGYVAKLDNTTNG
jgi:hypothetical protein